MSGCPKASSCYRRTAKSSWRCEHCYQQNDYEPFELPYTIDDLIETGREMGVVHFDLLDDRDEGADEPMWHWDVWDRYPRKHHNILKPWSIRFNWFGFAWMKKYGRRLPFTVYYDAWSFMTTDPKAIVGCQSVLSPDISPTRGLARALDDFYCAKVCEHSLRCDVQYDTCAKRGQIAREGRIREIRERDGAGATTGGD